MRKARTYGLGLLTAGLALALSLSLTGCPGGNGDTSVPWLPYITPAQPTVTVGEELTLTVTGMPYGAAIEWQSSRPDCVRVMGEGHTATVEGLLTTGATPARITARGGGFYAFVDIDARDMFAWTFSAPPPPGWPDALGDTGGGAPIPPAGANDFDILNNAPAGSAGERAMRILGSHTSGIAWGSHAGRLQVRGLNSGEDYFLEIPGVQKPFSVTVFYADTGGNGNRFVTFYDGDNRVWQGRGTDFNQNQISSTADFPGTGTTTARIGIGGGALRIYGVVLSTALSRIPPVSGIALEPGFSIEQGLTRDIDARVSPENTDNPDLSWASSDPGVAIVETANVGGVRVPRLTAVGAGTATLTASSVMFPRHSATMQVTVTDPPPVASLEIAGAGTVLPGREVTLNAVVLPAHAHDTSVIWNVTSAPTTGVFSIVGETPTSITLRADGSGEINVEATTVGKDAEGQSISATHAVEVGGVGLYRRVFTFGAANTAHVAGPPPAFANGRLTIQGSGTTDGNNFMGHLVWVSIPVSIATFDAELDLVVGPGGSSYGGSGNNTKISLFAAVGNPANGLASEAAFNGWFNEFAASPRTSRAIRIFDNTGAGGTLGGFQHRSELLPPAISDLANPPAGATIATMRLRHGDPNINGFRTSIFYNDANATGGHGGVNNNAMIPISPSDQVYIGIFVTSNNANLSTAVVDALRIRFDGDTEFTTVNLGGEITLVE